jgi:hypothetical protein
MPREDESLYSLAARIRAKNAARNDHDACCAMFANSRSTRVDEFPVNLAHFCACTKYAFGDEQSILASLTLVEYFCRLGSKPWRTGAEQLSPLQSRYGLISLSHGTATRWQYCSSCLTCDRERWGMGYWRRCHQLPGTMLCPLDGTQLSRGRTSKTALHTRFVLPDDLMPEKMEADAAIEANRHTLMRIAHLNARILWHAGHAMDNDTLSAAMVAQLKERGLTKADGTLRPHDFLSDFRNCYKGLCDLPEYTILFGEPAITRLIGAIVRKELPCSSLHTALVIDYLFGSWDAALEHCRWCEAFNVPDVQAQQVHHSWPPADDLLHEHRAICLALVKKYPGLGRSAFAREAPRSFRWLLSHDSRWLSSSVQCHRSTHQRQLL